MFYFKTQIAELLRREELPNQYTNKNDAKAFNQLLERIRGDWNIKRQKTVNVHSRLQTCIEISRKYDATQETRFPCLYQPEEEFHRMQAVTLGKKKVGSLGKS